VTNKKEITCIVCPIGCKIVVKIDGLEFTILEGNKCKKGIEYAKSEAIDPRRMLTTSVLVEGGSWPLVSVKSSEPISKDKLFRVLDEVKKKKVPAPINLNQIVIKNVANTKINLIATKK